MLALVGVVMCLEAVGIVDPGPAPPPRRAAAEKAVERPAAWRVSKRVNPMTDQVDVYASAAAGAPVADLMGRLHVPELGIQCQDNRTMMWLDTGNILTSRAPVRMRIGSGEAERVTVAPTTESSAVEIRGAISHAKRMIGETHVLFEVVLVETSAQTTGFELRGFDEAIDEIREACGW